MRSQIRPALVSLLVLTALTGLVYPTAVTVVAQLVFPSQANGSLIVEDGRVRGSELIGQPFSAPHYFWTRPSATAPAYNAGASSGSNYGPLNPAQVDAVKAAAQRLHEADPANTTPIPVDLITASGSGLDPHISPAAAYWQVSRVARARGLSEEVVRALVADHVESRTVGLLGEPRVNVLRMNLALDRTRP